MNIVELTSLDVEGAAVYAGLNFKGQRTEQREQSKPACSAESRRTKSEAQQVNKSTGQQVDGGLFVAESPKVIRVALDAGYEPVSLLMERRHLTGDAADIVARCGDIPIYTGERELLAQLTGYTLTRGVLCAMRRPEPKTVEEVLRGASRVCVIDGVCDSTNIGAIFRSAAALGIDGVLVTPDSCDPLNRRAVRVSMGAVFLVPWAFVPGDEGQRVNRSTDGAARAERSLLQFCRVATDEERCSTSQQVNESTGQQVEPGCIPRVDSWTRGLVDPIKALGFKTVAMALTDDSLPIDSPLLAAEPRLAIIMGTEGDGLPHDVIRQADYVARIPMAHGVDSLNVAAASAVAFWELRERKT